MRPGDIGHGGAAFYEEEYVHVTAVVEFGMADWEEVGVVALGDFEEEMDGGMLSRCVWRQLSRKGCSEDICGSGCRK